MKRYEGGARCHIRDGALVGGMKKEKEIHSRLAFLNVRLFVAASEGEELVVDVRHVGEGVTEFAKERV